VPANEYHFITTWRLESTPEEITEILGDGPDLARWWPSVYLDVKQVEAGDPNGIGAVVSLYTKGWLPYTLRWSFRVTENRSPYGFSLEAFGDFVGRGIWTFEQVGQETIATYDWQIFAEKGVLKTLSLIMKPIFSANHHWAMRKGEESLKLELARRRATTLDARMRIPAPAGPTFPHNLRRRGKR
jgi:hypothetical protein